MEYLLALEKRKESFLDKTRYLLADNRSVKSFLKEQLDKKPLLEAEVQKIKHILSVNMTHYVWYCEVPLQNGFLVFIADPTYRRDTTQNVFYCEALFCDEHLSLLSFES